MRLAVRELVDLDAVHGDVPDELLTLLVAHDRDAGDGLSPGLPTRHVAGELDMRPAVAEIRGHAVGAAKERGARVGVDVESRRPTTEGSLDIEGELREFLALESLEGRASRD